MRRVSSHPEAEEELKEAALFCERRCPGLREAFLDEFEATLARIVAEPERWRCVREENRKLNFNRFPHAIIYSATVNDLFIKAVMHLHRRPFYWSRQEDIG